jgi:hypothetical protein
MSHRDTKIAIFADYHETKAAVRKLAAANFDVTNLSVVGKRCPSEEKIGGFYDLGGRVTFWGARGAFWGDLWGVFAGGVSLTIPMVGPVMVLGYLAAALVAAVEDALPAGGLGALGAALYSVGTPKDCLSQYEQAVKCDGFLVMARGSDDELASAKRMLETIHPLLLDRYQGVKPRKPAGHAAAMPA